jgi:sulfatase maturation enzyme AslB (radical SAM superfamily)
VSFEKNFCPSPWFHTRINNTGNYEYCRWAVHHDREKSPNVREQNPIEWFQHGMSGVREAMLAGQPVAGCKECYLMEQHGKISGRQRQLLKIGVSLTDFEKTMLSSPWIKVFHESSKTQGTTDQLPQDWQIDLGNFCNSACVFCDPYSSSRLATEFKKIGLINNVPSRAWSDDANVLASFIDMLKKSPSLAYLHFIGGETLITPSFRVFLQSLVDAGLSDNLTIGFTTNLTVWDDHIVSLLEKFHQINLGMSLECLHPVNDYIRYGSSVQDVQKLMQQWIEVAQQQHWLIQVRITPTLLSIAHLDTVYEFAMQHGIAVESCNFLNDPAFLRPSVLPRLWRDQAITKIQSWIDKQDIDHGISVVNTRNPDFAPQQIIEDAKSYVRYLKDEPDESFRLTELVSYLKLLEKNRGNSVIDYLPEYEEIFRSAGY